jgi:hypothetical protein
LTSSVLTSPISTAPAGHTGRQQTKAHLAGNGLVVVHLALRNPCKHKENHRMAGEIVDEKVQKTLLDGGVSVPVTRCGQNCVTLACQLGDVSSPRARFVGRQVCLREIRQHEIALLAQLVR